MSKYLEYTRHANTGATKDSAPVLGTFLNRDKLALEALCEEIRLNGGAPMDSETLLYILSGTVDYLREQFATKCVRYRFFGITFEVACYGPFETADAKFDPAVNSLEVAVRLGDELKNCLVNETPTLVTEETASTARIYRAMDIASGALGIIIGTRSFRVTGRNVYVSREGESLKLMDGKGRVYDLVYDRIESPQRVECHLAENLQESGTCKLILTTYAGDESEEARLGIYERVVNFVKFVEPVPDPTYPITSEDGKFTLYDPSAVRPDANALNCHFEIAEGLAELDINAGLAGTKLSKSLTSAEGGVACTYCNIDETYPSLLHVKFGAHDAQVGDKRYVHLTYAEGKKMVLPVTVTEEE